MSIALLLPAALAALAALALPLLIHLARRLQQRPIAFAALRWLRANPKPDRRIRFDEWPLLLLRLVLLVLLALWLARPVLTGADPATSWTVVAPGAAQAVPATPEERDAGEWRWLAPGFPGIDAAPPDGPLPTASLLRELDAQLPPAVALTVLVPERLAGMDAQWPRLSREVEWRVVAGGDPVPEVERPIPDLRVRHDEAHRDAARYLRAAAQAWDDEATDARVVVMGTDEGLPPPTATLAWLRADALPAEVAQWVEQGGQVLLAADAAEPGPDAEAAIWRDQAGQPLLLATGRGQGRLLRFARPLRPETMPQLLEASFPDRLRDVLQPVPVPTLAAADANPPHADAPAWTPSPRELRPWLAMLAAALLLLERWLATSRRRERLA